MEFMQWREYSTDFEDKPVSMQLKPLTRKANLVFIKHADVFAQAAKIDNMTIEQQVEQFEKIENVLEEMKPHFLKHVKDFKINDEILKRDQTMDSPTDELSDFYDYPAATILVINILSELSRISNLSPADTKN
jgi:hypothetical protein